MTLKCRYCRKQITQAEYEAGAGYCSEDCYSWDHGRTVPGVAELTGGKDASREEKL